MQAQRISLLTAVDAVGHWSDALVIEAEGESGTCRIG